MGNVALTIYIILCTGRATFGITQLDQSVIEESSSVLFFCIEVLSGEVLQDTNVTLESIPDSSARGKWVIVLENVYAVPSRLI